MILPFDNYEIHGCRNVGGDACETCDDADAEFWTLYGHLPEGGLEAIGDLKSRKHAEEVFERITGQPFGSHEENQTTARAMVYARPRLEFISGVIDDVLAVIDKIEKGRV